MHEQKFTELAMFQANNNCVSDQHKCFSEKFGDSSRATSPGYVESI